TLFVYTTLFRSGSVDGDRGPGIPSVADDGAVSSGPTTPGLGTDGVRLDARAGDGPDTGDPAVSEAVHAGSGAEDSGRDLSGNPVDWAGGSARPSGFQARLQANIAALETLGELDAGSAYATQDQQQRLAGWSSWGALPEVFDPTSDRVTAETRDYVWELLGEDCWQQARATTLNAHYTD